MKNQRKTSKRKLNNVKTANNVKEGETDSPKPTFEEESVTFFLSICSNLQENITKLLKLLLNICTSKMLFIIYIS